MILTVGQLDGRPYYRYGFNSFLRYIVSRNLSLPLVGTPDSLTMDCSGLERPADPSWVLSPSEKQILLAGRTITKVCPQYTVSVECAPCTSQLIERGFPPPDYSDCYVAETVDETLFSPEVIPCFVSETMLMTQTLLFPGSTTSLRTIPLNMPLVGTVSLLFVPKQGFRQLLPDHRTWWEEESIIADRMPVFSPGNAMIYQRAIIWWLISSAFDRAYLHKETFFEKYLTRSNKGYKVGSLNVKDTKYWYIGDYVKHGNLSYSHGVASFLLSENFFQDLV